MSPPVIPQERRGRHARTDDSVPPFALTRSLSGPRHAAPALPDIAPALSFLPRRRPPWYRTRAVVPAISALAVLAVAVAATLLMLRDPEPVPQRPEPGPAPVTTAATASPLPVSPEPLPPPAPPVVTVESASPAQPEPEPQPTYQAPRHPAPTPDRKPEIGVTRTPVTRKPISAVPPPPPTTGRNLATPGDDRGGWGLW